jgi:hypothetical protein
MGDNAMKHPMKHVTLFAFLFAGLAACDTPPSGPVPGEAGIRAPAFAVIINERNPFVLVTENPCNGEPFTAEGEFHVLVTANTSPSGNTQVHVHLNAHGEGTSATGARYIFNEALNLHARQQGDGPIVEQDVVSILFIRQGTSDVPDNFVAKINVRFTIDPVTGDVEIVREKISLECRG